MIFGGLIYLAAAIMTLLWFLVVRKETSDEDSAAKEVETKRLVSRNNQASGISDEEYGEDV